MRKIYLLALFVCVFSLTHFTFVESASFEAVQDSNHPDRTAKPVDFKEPVLPKAGGKLTLVVELSGKPTSQLYAEAIRNGVGLKAAKSVASAAVTQIRGEQNALRSSLQSFGAVELFSMQRVLNAIVVRADASRISDLQKMPGVKRVSIAPRHTIENSTSVPFIGGNVAWDTTGVLSTLGLTGNGITIAIIDTGVDYLHANFDGNSALYVSQDPTVINSDGVTFPTARVINGFDFVGDNYDASGNSGSPIPIPDSDPTDCNGHGSHVAGSAAGNGVLGGAAYTGGYDSLSAGTLSGFDIGPGVAPEASIVALKVFGCNGSTDVTLQAIEFATDPNGDTDFSDHYDVINMSLGSSYGFAGAEIDAIENAVAAGVIVVTSAGNSGDIHYISGSPGSATSAISTAAAADNGVINTKLDVDLNGDDNIDNNFLAVQQAAYAPSVSGVFPPTVTKLQAPPVNNLGCNASDFAGFTPGNVAYIARGTCSGKLKVFNAEGAGASAVVIISTDNIPVALADDGAVGSVNIPAVMIAQGSGALITPSLATAKAQINSNGTSSADIIAGFSSRGPRRKNLTGQTQLKPDITAPGVNITSTQTCFTGAGCVGNESLTISGTSMASPHVAGVMALLRELHPTWSVPELKALVMNTANHDVFNQNLITGAQNIRMGTARQGAGRVDVVAATTDSVFAYGTANPNAVSLTFTADVLNGTTSTDSQSVTITNQSASPVTYNTAIDTSKDTTGIAFSVSPSSVTVPAFSTAAVNVTVTYTASAMTHFTDPTSSTSQGTTSVSRNWLSEETGYLSLVPTAGATVPLRVPLYADARPASDMDSPSVVGVGAATGVVSIPLTGIQVDQGVGRELYRGRVVAFQLMYTSPEINPGADLFDGGDIQYVGTTSDIVFGGTTSFIGMSMYGEWDTPRMRDVYICLDLDQDGTGGAFGDGTDFCYVARPQPNTDTFMIFLWDINGFISPAGSLALWDYQNALSPTTRETRLFNNDVLFMPVDTAPAVWPGVPFTSGAGDSTQAFDFYVMTADFNDPVALGGGITDSTPTLTFDPANPQLNHAEGTNEGFRIDPMVTDANGTAFDFVYNLVGDPDGQAEVLLLHFYNQPGDRADVVTVAGNLLTVAADGAGGGTIIDTTPGGTINCISAAGVESGDCTQIAANNAVYALTATPDSTSDFIIWTGCDSTSGTNNEICNLTITASRTVTATFQPQPILTVAGSGLGSGTMNDITPGGAINCTSTAGSSSGDCSEQISGGTVFAIAATPDGNSDFTGWIGCDSTSGTNNEICNITLTANIIVTASFSAEPVLSVSGSGTGTGTMIDTIPGGTINCTSIAGTSIGDCSEQPDTGTVFAISAAPDSNSDFSGWVGCDSISGANNEICNITLTADRTVTANFNVEPILTVSGAGTGNGTMTDIAPGATISCSSTGGSSSGDCSEQPDVGTLFAVVATPSTGSFFNSWTGCDSTSTTNLPGDTCIIQLNANATVTASFTSCPTITLSPATMPDSNVNANYNQVVTASNGVSPYTFALTSGTLPDGLTLSSDGTLSGIPTTINTYTFDITATDANQCTGVASYTVNIDKEILLFDDFEDGTMDWNRITGNCQEVNGQLVCNATNKKVRLYAPVPWNPSGDSGCSVCAVDFDLNLAAAPLSKVMIQMWYQDNQNLVQLMIKEDRDKIVLLQKANGSVVAKQSAAFTIDPGVDYHFTVGFDGQSFTVSVGGQTIITMTPSTIPNGNFGIRVIRTSASFSEITIM